MQFKRSLIVLILAISGCCSEDKQLVVGPMSMTMQSFAQQGAVVSSPEGQSHKHWIYQRYYNQDDWLKSLIWNLIGYSTVLIPGFLFIRMAKYSNFNELDGKMRLRGMCIWFNNMISLRKEQICKKYLGSGFEKRGLLLSL